MQFLAKPWLFFVCQMLVIQQKEWGSNNRLSPDCPRLVLPVVGRIIGVSIMEELDDLLCSHVSKHKSYNWNTMCNEGIKTNTYLRPHQKSNILVHTHKHCPSWIIMIQHLITLRSSFWQFASNKKCFRNKQDWRPQGEQFDLETYFLKIKWTHLLFFIIQSWRTDICSKFGNWFIRSSFWSWPY